MRCDAYITLESFADFPIQFLSSRPSTPVPFRPRRSDTQHLEVGPDLGEQKKELNGAPPSAPDASSHIETKVNGH